MKITLSPSETVLRQGAANLMRGAEAVGGRLFLTNQRLVFESHAFNIQTGVTEIPLLHIRQTRLCWTKFLNVIPIFPNSLAVDTSGDIAYQFVVFGRKDWAAAIDAQVQAVRG